VGLTNSLMLFGAVSFQMSLFYLVNNKDEDIKRYTWIVIQSTISIFSGVLLFEGVSGVLHTHIFKELSSLALIFATLLHSTSWFIVMQCCVLAVAVKGKKTRAYSLLSPGGTRRAASGPSPRDFRMMDPTHAEIERQSAEQDCPEIHPEPMAMHQDTSRHSPLSSNMVESSRCWGGMVGHLASFATIAASKTFAAFAEETWGAPGVMVTPLVTCAYLGILLSVSGRIRALLINSDGVMDETEHVWEHVVFEIENEVCGLWCPTSSVRSAFSSSTGAISAGTRKNFICTRISRFGPAC